MNKTNTAVGTGGFLIGMVVMLVIVAVVFGLYLATQRAAEYASAPGAIEATSGPVTDVMNVVTATPVEAGVTPALVPAATQALSLPASPTPAGQGLVSVVSVMVAQGATVVRVTFDARQSTGDVFFVPPVLQVADQSLTPTPDSLKAAKLAMLDAITKGQARTSLDFAISGIGKTDGLLIFNPTGMPGSIVNPRIELPVEWGAPAATPSN